MARLNNIVKFVLLNMNIFLCFVGTFFIGFAFYLWFADWGSLGSGFFVGLGFISALFGIVLALLSCVGCQGINHQLRKFGSSSKIWTGRRIIFLHLIFLILGLVGEVYVLRTSLAAVQKFSDVHGELDLNPNSYPKYVTFEDSLSKRFNGFFYGASSECKTTLYLWFWGWVNNNCPSSLNQENCQGCESYSLTFCAADQALCDDTYDNPYCPYTICRAGLLHYFEYRIRPFAYTLLAVICLQLIFILMDFMILCFHPRDSLQKILEKSGTVQRV